MTNRETAIALGDIATMLDSTTCPSRCAHGGCCTLPVDHPSTQEHEAWGGPGGAKLYCTWTDAEAVTDGSYVEYRKEQS